MYPVLLFTVDNYSKTLDSTINRYARSTGVFLTCQSSLLTNVKDGQLCERETGYTQEVASKLLQRAVEVDACSICRKQPDADQGYIKGDSPTMKCRPHTNLERGPQLIGEEERRHGQHEDMARYVVAPPKPRYAATPFWWWWCPQVEELGVGRGADG